jgi:2'-5' RNA ligase
LLDEKHYALVEGLWRELEREFGVRGVYVTPYPHFSYHVAADYNLERLKPVLDRFGKEQAGFSVRTSGLGIFTGGQPVLYIPVVCSPILTGLHQKLWPAISEVATGSQHYYRPDYWLPHITLGFADLDKANLAQIVPWLSEQSFDWEISINNLALIYDSGTGQEIKYRVRPGEPGN